MKKTLLVLIGGLILILVLVVWAYLFVFGTPQSVGEVFTDLGFTPDTSRPVTVVEPTPIEPPRVDTSGEPLRQLTTRPVAGYQYLDTAVRYVEIGTGHIYEINLTTGTEERLTGTTIPRVTEAYFSASGTVAALISSQGYERETFLARITDEGLVGTNLIPNAENIRATETGAQFSVTTETGSTGFSYTLTDNTQKELWQIPLKEVHIDWGNTVTTGYTKPDPDVEGLFFEVEKTKITSLLPAAFGLVVLSNDTYTVTTKRDVDRLVSSIALSNGGETPVAVPVIPEKCSFSPLPTELICGSPIAAIDAYFLRKWYMGAEQSEDLLWSISLSDGSATLVSDLAEESGRTIDVTQLRATGPYIYFVNKLDNTLWMYES